MWMMIALIVVAAIVLVISTDQFVSGASTVASSMNASPVLIGAVILGCGTGLPELAITFYGSHESPFQQIFHTSNSGGTSGIALTIALLVLVAFLVAPALFPDRFERHSPMIMAATIGFSALLRGSLDRAEAFAMVAGFILGVGWIVQSEKAEAYDPFSPIIEDKYQESGGFLDGPVMSHTQVGALRTFIGLIGTALGAQLMAYAANQILTQSHATSLMRNLVFIGIASLLPHVVVAVQALRQHHEGLAVGNLIGSNLFNSLVLGGMMAMIRPYQVTAGFSFFFLGIAFSTCVLTWMLLHTTDDEVSRWQGLGTLGAYASLVLFAVL